MGRIRLQHVFVGAMACAGVSAFLAAPWTSSYRPRIEAMFAPVAKPSASGARWVHDRFFPPDRNDARAADDVRAENDALRAEVSHLTVQLDELKRLNQDRAGLGRVRQLSTPVAVVGGDAGAAQSLALMPSPGLAEHMNVMHPGGVVGRVVGVGPLGARVRLITDRNFNVEGEAGHYETGPNGQTRWQPRGAPPLVLTGQGGNRMLARVPAAERADLNVGDTIVLKDPTWERDVAGQPLGRIVTIAPRKDVALWYDVVVEPSVVLNRLNYVLVMDRKAPPAVAAGG